MSLPPLDQPPADPPPAVRSALDVLPDLALFRVVAHAGDVFAPWLDLGGALLTRLELSPVLREVAILALAVAEGCEYEIVQHAAIALTAGLSPDQVAGLRRGSSEALDDASRLVAGAAREYVAGAGVSAETMAEVRDALGTRATVELLLVLGHYLAIARLVSSAGLAPEEPAHVTVVSDARS